MLLGFSDVEATSNAFPWWGYVIGLLFLWFISASIHGLIGWYFERRERTIRWEKYQKWKAKQHKLTNQSNTNRPATAATESTSSPSASSSLSGSTKRNKKTKTTSTKETPASNPPPRTVDLDSIISGVAYYSTITKANGYSSGDVEAAQEQLFYLRRRAMEMDAEHLARLPPSADEDEEEVNDTSEMSYRPRSEEQDGFHVF